MVFKKQANEEGNYIGQDGKRYEILSCERTESKKWREIGRKNIEVEPGVFVEEPIWESYIAINDGWDEFANIEEAAGAYCLLLSSLDEDL